MSRKPLLGIWRLLWPAGVAACLFPVRFGTLRLALVLILFLLWAGALFLFSHRRWVRAACIAVALLAGALLLPPGRAGDAPELRREYVRALSAYEGAPYVWGGETRWGIDCSGLPRCALIDANLRMGLRTANPRLLREALALWWFDTSARALGEGGGGKTRLLLATPGINSLDHTRILPGDIAVTENGVHCLAYAGNRTWLEADPGPMRVLRVTVPTESNVWFDQPVRVLRWREMEQVQ